MNFQFKKHITAILLASMVFSSCGDSFLNEINPNKETPATYWVNEANVTKGLAAMYNPIRRMTWGYYGGYTGILHYQMRADDMYPTRGEEPSIWEILSFTNTSNTSNGCWNYLYTGIQLANEFLYNAPRASMDQNRLSEMLGEAYFLRGFQYFRIRTDFNQGVIRTLPQDADPVAHGLSSAEDVLERVILDMKEAKERLPKVRPANERGRVTKGAAIAMLGKAYLWKGEYALAKAEFEEIMDSYGYDLMDNYEDNFRDNTKFNKESIWEINYEAFGDETDAWGSSTGSNAFMGSVIAHYFGPNLPNNTKDENPGVCRGGGWYKMQPSPYLIKQFVAEPRPNGSDTKWDKRLYTTAFMKNSDYNDVAPDEVFYGAFDFDLIYHRTTVEPDKKYAKGEPAYPTIEGKPGRFLMKKFAVWYNPTGCSMYHNNEGRINNYRIMRFAEVLFLHAEASLQLNDTEGAMKDINRIRQRAGLSVKNLSDSESIWEELRNQKLLEFAGENVRWDDLVRWYTPEQIKSIMMERKKDTKVKDGKDQWTGEIEDTQNFSRFEKKYMYFPIPQSEVDANLNLTQKEEWR